MTGLYNTVPYIRIQLQDGPIDEVGINGCQIDDVIAWCRDRLIAFNQPPYGVVENNLAIRGLEDALYWLKVRAANRKRREVEGTSIP